MRWEKLVLTPHDFPVPVEGAWSLSGTPADCVQVALDGLLPVKPDFVFSGMNNGYNTGMDIAYSGTVGAAMEALMNGIPAIAFVYRVDETEKQVIIVTVKYSGSEF